MLKFIKSFKAVPVMMWVFSLFLLSMKYGHGDIKLLPIYQDGMVFQRDQRATIAGFAAAGEEIYVKQGDKVIGQTVGKGPNEPWQIELPPMASGPISDLTIVGNNTVVLKNLLAGEVWLCSGQSNMAMTIKKGAWCWYGEVDHADQVVAESQDDQLRFQQLGTPGWVSASPQTAPQLSATAYFFGRYLRQKLGVPIGLIVRAVGSTSAEQWTPAKALSGDPEFIDYQKQVRTEVARISAIMQEEKSKMDAWKQAVEQAKIQNTPPPAKPASKLLPGEETLVRDSFPILNPGNLANNILDLVPLNFRGVIWYQGESNGKRADQYAHLLSVMIGSWRQAFGHNFPFLIVQLPNFGRPVESDDMVCWPLLREAEERIAVTVPDCGVVPTIDTGNPGNIHPSHKQPVGERLALLALKQVYHQDVVAAGPRITHATFAGDKAILTLDKDCGKPVLKGTAGFQLAGEDRIWHDAIAVLSNDQIEVTSSEVGAPVAVRYAWLNNPSVSLFNEEGWPGFPYRSDHWAVSSQ